MQRSRAVVALLALAACSSGCGKTSVHTPITWYFDLASGAAAAARENKPAMVVFGASWDCAWKELEYVTLRDPRVQGIVHSDFVAIYMDATDEDNKELRHAQERFHVIGDPTIVFVRADFTTELARYTEYVPPDRFAVTLLDTRERARRSAVKSP